MKIEYVFLLLGFILIYYIIKNIKEDKIIFAFFIPIYAIFLSLVQFLDWTFLQLVTVFISILAICFSGFILYLSMRIIFWREEEAKENLGIILLINSLISIYEAACGLIPIVIL